MVLQMAAAKAPQVLAPRRRKAVNYNEAKLHRKYASASESEQTATKADTDGDSSEAEDGAEVKVSCHLEHPLSVTHPLCIHY